MKYLYIIMFNIIFTTAENLYKEMLSAVMVDIIKCMFNKNAYKEIIENYKKFDKEMESKRKIYRLPKEINDKQDEYSFSLWTIKNLDNTIENDDKSRLDHWRYSGILLMPIKINDISGVIEHCSEGGANSGYLYLYTEISKALQDFNYRIFNQFNKNRNRIFWCAVLVFIISAIIIYIYSMR